MKRMFDIIVSLILISILSGPMVLVGISILLSSKGPIVFWSKRVGRNNVIFKMPKFRTMRLDTPDIPTHLLDSPGQYLSPVGSFLRRLSLDELPQLFSILVGDMSFIGPRPALFNQNDLITLRTSYNIEKIKPGLTGWAQINGRDDLSIVEKVEMDLYYMNNQSIFLDIKIFFLTALKVFKANNISH